MPQKSPRKFSPHTKSYKLFEKLFLELPPDSYPFKLEGLTKGQAVNMAMLLNGCQQYWAHTSGLPEEMLQRSAKAKLNADGSWFVEISDSPKHTRNRRHPQDWLSNVLARLETPTPAPAPTPEPPDFNMDIFTKFSPPLRARPTEPGENTPPKADGSD